MPTISNPLLFKVQIEVRSYDGGLRLASTDLKGLHLAGQRIHVMNCVSPAANYLLESRLNREQHLFG